MNRGFKTLAADHPVATAFVDETGSIANDRFFAIGCLKLREPSRLLRKIQKFRDRRHWYNEIKFSGVVRGRLELLREIVDLVAEEAGCEYRCFVADRQVADPIERFGTHWDAYAKLAEQLLVASIRPHELLSVLADNYSTPDDVLFEEVLRASVNRRLRRLAVVSACRLDSRSTDGLQIVDLLTSGVAFEFREDAGLASPKSPKAELAQHIRTSLGAQTLLNGWKTETRSIQTYTHGSWQPSV